MRVLTGDPGDWEIAKERSVVAIGVFDGVHRGHQAVLDDLVSLGERTNGPGTVRGVLTFDPHPLAVVAPDRAPRLLGTIHQRLSQLEAHGVDVVGVLPFTRIRSMEPDEFIKSVLVDALAARAVAVGADFRFGMNRAGDVATLVAAGERWGFLVDAVPLLSEHDSQLSSTRIRVLISEGNVEEAAELLGRPYAIEGPVVRGDGRGTTIGIPTANVNYEPTIVLPETGVYAGYAILEQGRVPAVTNVGIRPTFDGRSVTVEAHLIDWAGDLYGRVIEVELTHRLRAEQKFAGIENLVAQIHTDIAAARDVLNARSPLRRTERPGLG